MIVTILALSANVHPWYLTWIVPLLALYPIPGLLLWTGRPDRLQGPDRLDRPRPLERH